MRCFFRSTVRFPTCRQVCRSQNDRTITISVIAGSSNGLKHQLTKAKTSIGQTGGGADIEIDDPQVSPLHCVVGVANDIVRLCDLDSVSGTYANEERVQAAELEHLSEFRLGSAHAWRSLDIY
jgi:pSer/pThr/pTyr-binding forkhead associated (FHA) protein